MNSECSNQIQFCTVELRNTKYEARSAFWSIDWVLVLLYATLMVCGAVSIYAASYDYDHASMFSLTEFSGRQFLWIGISLLIGFCILIIDRRFFEAYAYPIYAVAVFLMVLTIFVATDIKGSRSWIVLGPISFQSAEFGKFATALALAKLFGGYNFVLNRSYKNYIKAFAIILVPIILIFLQKETGSAIVYTSLIFVLYREGMSGFVLFAGLCAVTFFVVVVKYSESMLMGIPLGEFITFIIIMVIMIGMVAFYSKSLKTARNLLLGFMGCGVIAYGLTFVDIYINGLVFFFVVIGGGLVYLLVAMFVEKLRKVIPALLFVLASVGFMFTVDYAFNNALEPYQQMRIKVSLGLEEDLRGAGYNVNQSKIAIGSGGVTGKGFLNGTQTKLKYVPEQHTDFIFCTIGEEQGFIGTTMILVLYLALILRIIHIAERQRTAFGRVYAYCVASYLIFHLGINIGMVVGLSPVIGIPLPLFSYGGSALLAFTMQLFILLKIDSARREFGN